MTIMVSLCLFVLFCTRLESAVSFLWSCWSVTHSDEGRFDWAILFFFILIRSSSHLWSILVGSLSCTDLAIKQNVAFYKKDWDLFSFSHQKEVCNLWSLLDCERGGRALWRSDAFSFLPDSSFGFSICIQIVFSWGETGSKAMNYFLPIQPHLDDGSTSVISSGRLIRRTAWTLRTVVRTGTDECDIWNGRATQFPFLDIHDRCRTSALYAVLVLLSLWTVVPMFVHFQFVCHIFSHSNGHTLR